MTDVVRRTKEVMTSVMAQHEWPSPEIRERLTMELLAVIDSVPHRGDDDAYIGEAWAAACEVMNPHVLHSRALAEFTRMPTSRTIH